VDLNYTLKCGFHVSENTLHFHYEVLFREIIPDHYCIIQHT